VRHGTIDGQLAVERFGDLGSGRAGIGGVEERIGAAGKIERAGFRKGQVSMRVLAVAVGLGLLLAPSGALAQARGAAPPAGPRPGPQAPPAPRPAQPAPQAPAAPPVPLAQFQDGLKYAYLRVDVIAASSVEGRAANEKVKALNDQKVRELNERNKALQTAQQKLDQGGSVLNDAARAQLQQEIERQQRDLQRFTEDAQQDVQALQQQLQEEFQRKLNPIVDRVAREKQVHMVFSAADSGLVWADPTMDLTADIIKAFDAAATAKPAAAAPAPAAPAPAPAAAPVAPGAR
jgi:Skp family chaperone for outer membrane proteins